LKKHIQYASEDNLYYLIKRLQLLLLLKRQERELSHDRSNNDSKPIGLLRLVRYDPIKNKYNRFEDDDTIAFNLKCPLCDQIVEYDPKTRTLKDPKNLFVNVVMINK
jgi:hypothetical protein